MDAREMKIKAAAVALTHVKSGMRLGIGTGSTAEEFVRLLAEKVAGGFKIEGVPTSERTARLCVELGVPLKSLDELPELDLTIDGADEVDTALRLIKGGGGALLREKIVAAASTRMIVIADASKKVTRLGRFPLPIEVVPFGLLATERAIEKAIGAIQQPGPLTLRRGKDGHPFVTDSGHWIVDAALDRVDEPAALAHALSGVPGVVEHGLFIGLAHMAIVGGPDGVEIIEGRGISS